MKLGFLITQQNSFEVCKNYLNYLNYLLSNNIEIFLFCESYKDYKYFMKINTKKINIFYIYYELENNKKTLNFDISKYKNNDKLNIYLKKFFDQIFNQYSIKYLSINYADGIFYSYSAFYLDNYCKKNSIKILFPFPTPANGRFMIYDSIYLTSALFNKTYKKALANFQNLNLDKVNIYITNYINYENNYIYRNKRFKKSNIQLFDNLKTNIKIFFRRNLSKYKKIYYAKNNKYENFILYMLTKTDSHWFTNYANPDLNNRINNIDHIYRALPENYILILKFHPRIKIDYEIENYAINKPKLKLAYEKNNTNLSFDLTKKAKLIIGYGTTSLMHPLFQYKKVIDVGINSIYFNFNNPPVIRINSFKALTKELLLNFLNEKVYINKINAYFYALLKCSDLFYNNTNKILDIKPIDQKNILADKILKIINSLENEK